MYQNRDARHVNNNHPGITIMTRKLIDISTPLENDVPADPQLFRPSIRTKALSSDSFFRRCISTAGVEPELRLEDQDSGTSLADHFRWNFSFHQPSIRPLTAAMILLCEHPVAGPVRKRKNSFIVFPRRVSAVFCTGQSGCESAQSNKRPSFRRPWANASCPRCERSPDTACCCEASSRAELPAVVPPLPWLRLSAYCGSGVDTAYEILRLAD